MKKACEYHWSMHSTFFLGGSCSQAYVYWEATSMSVIFVCCTNLCEARSQVSTNGEIKVWNSCTSWYYKEMEIVGLYAIRCYQEVISACIFSCLQYKRIGLGAVVFMDQDHSDYTLCQSLILYTKSPYLIHPILNVVVVRSESIQCMSPQLHQN